MKTNNIIISLFLFSLMLSAASCKKEVVEETYTIKGKVVTSCDNLNPIKGYEVYLYNSYNQALISGSCKAGELGRAVTNENGEFEITYSSTCWKGELMLRYDLDNHSYRNLAIDMAANTDYNLGNLYKEDNGFYTYKIKTDTIYSNSDTLFYDISYNSKPIIVDSTTWYFDSTYKSVAGPFIDGMIIDYNSAAIPYIVKSNSSYIGNQIITRWVLKSGNTIHAFNRNQTGYIEPCKKFSDVVIDISK